MKQQFKILGLLALISISVLLFGCNSKMDTDELRHNVIEKEVLFENLVEYFTSILPDSTYIVTFGVDKRNFVNLSYYKNQGIIADPNNHFGGNHLKLHSPDLDQAIKGLSWTYEEISNLTNGLKAIQCENICNTDWFGKPINIYNSPSGFVNSEYNIYPLEMLDKVNQEIHRKPVAQTDFLKRVYIITSSAL